jgi:hypothetical protein
MCLWRCLSVCLSVCAPVCLWRCLWRCLSVALFVRSRVYASVYVPVCLLYTEILCRSRHFDWDVDVPLLGNMCLGELVALCSAVRKLCCFFPPFIS